MTSEPQNIDPTSDYVLEQLRPVLDGYRVVHVTKTNLGLLRLSLNTRLSELVTRGVLAKMPPVLVKITKNNHAKVAVGEENVADLQKHVDESPYIFHPW